MFSPVGRNGPTCLCIGGFRVCIRIQFAPLGSSPIYDAERQRITLPPLPPARAVTAVRAVLLELAVPQPQFGALCWCGEPVDPVPAPAQQRSEQVSNYGA